MTKGEIRILEMLVRVRQFILSRIAAFPAGLPGHDLYLTIDTSIKNMERHSTSQASHKHGAKGKTAQKHAADDSLRELMEAYNRTARSMSRKLPGTEEKFRLPSTKDIHTWLATARAFAADAEPLADEFVSRGMAPDFIDDLKARTLAVAKPLEEREEESSNRIESTADVEAAAQEGFKAARDLDAIVRNVFAGNAAELAAWESASHVERAPRRAAEEEEEPPTEPPPPQG